MRTIKFRAWDKITKQIFEVKQIDFNAIERNVYGWITYKELLGQVEESLSFRSFDDVELMQYTGLKDKKGKEIYEGDIVSHPNSSLKGAEVKFTKGLFRIVAKDGRDDLLYYCYDKLEVIGNIYQHKDLLK